MALSRNPDWDEFEPFECDCEDGCEMCDGSGMVYDAAKAKAAQEEAKAERWEAMQ